MISETCLDLNVGCIALAEPDVETTRYVQIAGGISLLINRYAPFFAVVLFPISLNVLLFHTILVPSGWLMGVTLMVPNLLLGWGYRKYYEGLFVMKAVM